MADKYTTQESWNFWKEILTLPDGTFDIKQAKKELHDFYVAMQEVPKVYCHITGDRLSKITYNAETVIDAADEHYKGRYGGDIE